MSIGKNLGTSFAWGWVVRSLMKRAKMWVPNYSRQSHYNVTIKSLTLLVGIYLMYSAGAWKYRTVSTVLQPVAIVFMTHHS